MFSLIQLPNLRWIPKVLSFSLSPQRPFPTQLAKDTKQENVRNFILICLTVPLIDGNRKRLNWHPVRIFEKLSQSCYPGVISPTIERRTITIFMIYAFRSASSKITPSTKYMEKIRSRSTFIAVLLPPPQHMHILKIDRLKCTSPFTVRLLYG